MAALNRSDWITQNGKRRSGFERNGFTGNMINPTSYDAYGARFPSGNRSDTGAPFNAVDVPNMTSLNPDATAFSNLLVSSFPSARNRSWESLVGNIRSNLQADLGILFAEMGKSSRMIAERALKCYRAAKALRAGRFRYFLRELGIGAKHKHKSKLRNKASEFGDLWLEYSYGWDPLFQGIYDGAVFLGAPLPYGKYRGVGAQTYSKSKIVGGIRYTHNGRAIVSQRCVATVSNPMTYALSQAGLINPLSIIWEVVPFSFVADWVFDVSSYLNSFSDLAGVSVSQPQTCLFVKTTSTVEWVGSFTSKQQSKAWRCLRSTSLSKPAPNLDIRENIGRSVKRAANAVSLLAQILGK
jgi:hypothetical protein